MSLDDECPTQYFGPGGVTFTGRHGKPLRVSRDHYLRLTKAGALTDEQMLNATEDGRSLQDILDEANAGVEDNDHRAGCSHSRTGNCICDYLAQWDDKVISLDDIPGVSEWDGVFKYPGTLLPQYGPHPEKDYLPIVEKPVKALVVNDGIWEPRKLRHDAETMSRYWYSEYKRASRRLVGTTIAGSVSALALIVTAVLRWTGL